MNKNQMLSILAEKEKEVAKNSEFSGGNGSGSKRNFVPFFNPNALFMNRTEVRVTVLPNMANGCWFKEYNKHMISLGKGNFKQFVCLSSEGRCPLCDFLKDNADNINDKKLVWQLSPKKVDVMFVYNPYAKQVQRYETQEQGLIDILKPLTDNKNDTDGFNDTGFDLIFQKNDDKYPRVVGIATPSVTIEQVYNEATNRDDVFIDDENYNIKTFESEIMPYSMTTTKKFINTTVQQIIKGVAGQFDVTPYLFSEEETKYVPQKTTTDGTLDGYDNYFPEADDTVAVDVNDFGQESVNEETEEEIKVNDFLNSYKRNNRR